MNCIVCHTEKSEDAFAVDRTRSTGRDPRCRDCKNGRAREAYAVLSAQRPARPAALGQSAYNRRWRVKNPGAARMATKRWEEAHPEKRKQYDSARRARKRGAEGTFTARQWQAMKVAFGHRCAYCGTRPDRLTQDHVIPLVRGGSHTASNIVPACQPCNSRKNAGPAPDFQPVLLLVE